VPGTLVANAALLTLPPTFYTRFGDAPWATLAAAVVLLPFLRALAATKRRGRRPS
jgi:hypothetical protein